MGWLSEYLFRVFRFDGFWAWFTLRTTQLRFPDKNVELRHIETENESFERVIFDWVLVEYIVECHRDGPEVKRLPKQLGLLRAVKRKKGKLAEVYEKCAVERKCPSYQKPEWGSIG